MMMHTVFDDAICVMPVPGKPEFAMIMGEGGGKAMRKEKAERIHLEHLREKAGLEALDQMPPSKPLGSAVTCRRCKQRALRRCAACKTPYCSKLCQKRAWKDHLFVCRVPGRPNDIDTLRIYVRHWFRARTKVEAAPSNEYSERVLKALLADDHICKTFGFNACETQDEAGGLLCLYRHLIERCGPVTLQKELASGDLGSFMEWWVRIRQGLGLDVDAGCMKWFLSMRQMPTRFPIPSQNEEYQTQLTAMCAAYDVLHIDAEASERKPLSNAERRVFRLYTILCRDFNNHPDVYSAQWIGFGFCFCRSVAQRDSLRRAFLAVAERGASLKDIAQAWESRTLLSLMKRQGIGIAQLVSDGIDPHGPEIEDLGIYRLMAEVSHTLSGRFCPCFKVQTPGYCHPKYEPHLSLESDGDYGFHASTPWERWQLFNFYSYVFCHRGFDARSMQLARRDPDPDALEKYLETIYPDLRRKLWNRYYANGLFPRLKSRVRFPNGRPPCQCVVHGVCNPPGLNCGESSPLDWFPEYSGRAFEDEMPESDDGGATCREA